MKKVTVLILLIISSATFSQTKKKYTLDCDDMNAIFSNPDFANIFISTMKDTVIFVDTFRVFSCKNILINGQPVVFLHKFTKEISHGDGSSFYIHQARLVKPSGKRYIVMERFEKRARHKFNLSFWQPENNHVWQFYLYKRKKTRIKIYEKGEY